MGSYCVMAAEFKFGITKKSRRWMVLMVAQPFKYTYVLNRILKNSESGKLCAFYYVDILFFCIFPSSLT